MTIEADALADLGLSWLDDTTLQPVFRGELSDFIEDVEKLHAQAAFYCDMKERHDSDPSQPLYDVTAHSMPTPRRYLRLFVQKFEKIQLALDACRNAWDGLALLGLGHWQGDETHNGRLWTDRRDTANALLEKLHKIETGCDRASKTIVPSKTGGRKARNDSPSEALKTKCVALKTGKGTLTWEKVRARIHRDFSHLLPKAQQKNSDYPSDGRMRIWQRELESKPR